MHSGTGKADERQGLLSSQEFSIGGNKKHLKRPTTASQNRSNSFNQTAAATGEIVQQEDDAESSQLLGKTDKGLYSRAGGFQSSYKNGVGRLSDD